ncbi:MAG: hypothetical protein ACJ8LM_17245, partial [Candidatus Udaeobacter sp.]
AVLSKVSSSPIGAGAVVTGARVKISIGRHVQPSSGLKHAPQRSIFKHRFPQLAQVFAQGKVR